MTDRFTPAHLDAWRRDGGLVIENFFTPDEVAAVQADFRAVFGAGDAERQALDIKNEGEVGRFNPDQFKGIKPVPIATLALTDARWWRNAGIPAYIYGCAPDGMASHDERVRLEEFLNVIRVHVLSAAAYLGGA